LLLTKQKPDPLAVAIFHTVPGKSNFPVKMVTIKLTSRLGNQLFQYAFGYAISRKWSTFFVVDIGNARHGYLIPRYFVLSRLDDFLTILFLRPCKFLLKMGLMQRMHQTNAMQPANVLLTASNYMQYSGYYQSLSYFIQNEQAIRKIFTIRQEFVTKYKRKYADISDKRTIVVHIRRTDYLKYGQENLGGPNMCLPDGYFMRCLQMIDHMDDYCLIFISDDIQYVKAQFAYRYPGARFEQNEEIIDLQLLMNADILVISNSTFAWWGAYLNPKPGKMVFAPKYWLGFKIRKEYPVNILLPSWKVVEVV
jgi:Glycosyl transferase family 11